MKGRHSTAEGGGGGRRGGAKRRRKNNFGTPWQTRRKLKGGGGALGRWACIRTAIGGEGNSGWVIGMLGWRRATPRWANDLAWQLEMLGLRQGTPMWEDEPMWWLWRGLGIMEGLGSINNNKQQSLGFEQSLTEDQKNHLIIWSHCSSPETS